MRRVKFLSLLLLLALVFSGAAQGKVPSDANYVSDIKPSEDADVLGLEVSGQNDQVGNAYFNYVSGSFVDSVGLYTAESVEPTQPPVENELRAAVSQTGDYKYFHVADKDGVEIYGLYDDKVLMANDVANLEVSAVEIPGGSVITVFAYDKSLDVTYYFFYSSIATSNLYVTGELDYRLNVHLSIYYPSEEIMMAAMGSGESETVSFFFFDENEIEYMQDVGDAEIILVDAYNSILGSVTYKGDDSFIQVNKYSSISRTGYNYSISSGDLAKFVPKASTEGAFLSLPLLLFPMTMVLVILIRKRT